MRDAEGAFHISSKVSLTSSDNFCYPPKPLYYLVLREMSADKSTIDNRGRDFTCSTQNHGTASALFNLLLAPYLLQWFLEGIIIDRGVFYVSNISSVLM